MTIYEPGTVAVIRDRFSDPIEWRAVRDDKGWSSLAPEIGWVADSDVIAVRPLVVLDLDGIAPEAIVAGLRSVDGGTNSTVWARVADQIEAQTKPPRIPEPGLWGVVEDSAGDVWICTEPHRWTRIVDGVEWPWVDLVDPVLIREGLES